MGLLSRFYFLFLLKLNIHIPCLREHPVFQERRRQNVCGSLACTQAAQAHYMNADVDLACERCCVTNGFLQRLVCYVAVFLKREKKMLFLNKIDVPYCLVVFFVVCPRLRPFWGVFGELVLFWCSTAKRKTRQNSDSRSVRRLRRIILLENYPRPQFLQKFKEEMLQFHVHSLGSQFLLQIVH